MFLSCQFFFEIIYATCNCREEIIHNINSKIRSSEHNLSIAKNKIDAYKANILGKEGDVIRIGLIISNLLNQNYNLEHELMKINASSSAYATLKQKMLKNSESIENHRRVAAEVEQKLISKKNDLDKLQYLIMDYANKISNLYSELYSVIHQKN